MAKKRDFKAEYARRIKNATKKGRTRQQARGHKAAEHVERKEREIEERGIAGSQEKTIERWYENYYNPGNYPSDARAPLDEVLDFAKGDGYAAFVQWRTVWDLARRTYISELTSGDWQSRGQPYLSHLATQAGVSDMSWLYYH